MSIIPSQYLIKLLHITSGKAHEASLHFKALKHYTGADESGIRGEKRGEKETVERELSRLVED